MGHHAGDGLAIRRNMGIGNGNDLRQVVELDVALERPG
jgi:hypothetical protein